MSLQAHNLIERPFVPAKLIASPHAQTIFAYLFRRPKVSRAIRRERWTTPDQDFVDVDWLDASRGQPTVLVLHGLEGSSRAGYVSALLQGAQRRGFGACALNFRSCSGEPNLLPQSYHSGATQDVRWLLERIRARAPGPIFAVGFSLGGNVLLRYLAEEGEKSVVSAAVAISVPYSLQACVRVLDSNQWPTAIYRHVFLRSLKSKAKAKARRFPHAFSLKKLAQIRTVEAFDDVITASVHGFAGAADYYAKCSSGSALEQIRRPTLLISAADDPMVPASSLPRIAKGHAYLQQEITERGGHVGFVGGSLWRPEYWAEERALAFLQTQVPRR
jgi:uncharacterized protein